MANWSNFNMPRGTYISPIFSVSNNLDKYIAKISEQVINTHFQTIEYYFRVSYDRLVWSDWKAFNTFTENLLDDYSLTDLNVQFKIIMLSETDAKKPYLQDFEIQFIPYSCIINTGDLPVKPKLWIRKKNGQGDIAIINYSTGQRVEFKDLNNDEEVFVDCENEEIVSSNQVNGVYRYDSHNDEFLELIRGENYITSEGDFELDIRFKGILLQE